MNKSLLLLLGVLILALGFSGAYYVIQKDTSTQTNSGSDKSVDLNKTQNSDQEEVTGNNSPTPEDDNSGSQVEGNGIYTQYSQNFLANADSGDVVLFFHASWCPICQGIERDINDNLSKIPSDLTILKVDYDTATELKQKYGVTYQYTFVQVDSQGNLLDKWSNTFDLESITERVI